MNLTVPNLTIACMIVSCVIAFGLPILLALYFHKKKGEFIPMIVGIAVMFVFVFTLEAAVNQTIFKSAIGETIRNNKILYAVYGGLMAAVFEECGRWIAYRTILKNRMGNDSNALMYGVGHGGCEAIMIVGFMMLNYITISIMMNKGTINDTLSQLDSLTLTKMNLAMQTLSTTPSYVFLLSGIERISAMMAQVSLSVLVWFSVKYKHKKYFFLALLFHFIMDAGTVLLRSQVESIILVELFIFVVAAIIVFVAYNVWCHFHTTSVKK